MKKVLILSLLVVLVIIICLTTYVTVALPAVGPAVNMEKKEFQT